MAYQCLYQVEAQDDFGIWHVVAEYRTVSQAVKTAYGMGDGSRVVRVTFDPDDYYAPGSYTRAVTWAYGDALGGVQV